MGLFDWLTAPDAPFLYTDGNGNHRLTAPQFGEKCVVNAAFMAEVNVRDLCSFGKGRADTDILAKMRQVQFIALAHGTAFFAAVYSTYPVLRLGISNEIFKSILSGVNNAISGGLITLKGHPNSPEYRRDLTSEIGQYCAILLETAGIAIQPGQDRMLVGTGGALQRLLFLLDQGYSQIPMQQDSEHEDSSSNGNLPDESNWLKGKFINPAIEASRNIDSEKLLMSVFATAATRVVKAIDESKSVALAK